MSSHRSEQLTKYSRYPRRLITLCIAIAAGILVADARLPIGVAGGVPYVAVVLLALWTERPRYVVAIALMCCALTVVGAFWSPPGPVLWQAVLNRVLALFVICVAAGMGLRRHRLMRAHEAAIRDREKAIEEVKILRGLIPICASCKQIRNEDGLWDGFESYIRDHTDADFTHGICPVCVEQLYGHAIDTSKLS